MNNRIDKDTFGSSEKYHMLIYLTEKISMMDEKERNYISRVITDINATIKKSELIGDIGFRHYVLDLVKADFNRRIDRFIVDRYEYSVVSRLRNFLHAKVNHSKCGN